VQPIEMFKRNPDGDNKSVPFVNGFADGRAARSSKQTLSAYLKVGIDDYAKGFRAGFFTRSPLGSARSSGSNNTDSTLQSAVRRQLATR
jgi:hypothetical protein